MVEIMVNQAASCDLKELVQKFIPEVIGKEIEKQTAGIFPLQNVYVRKVKILKAPKFDLGKLMEVIVSQHHIHCGSVQCSCPCLLNF
jgi:small subunit ribosomal protein S3Ae